MAIVVMSSFSTDDNYEPVRVFLCPTVNSQSFVLVDSALERTFAKIAINVLLNNPEHKGYFVKPLTSKFIDGIPITPDFLHYIGHDCTVFEVMGMDRDPSYLERKQRTIPLMTQHFGPVTEVGIATTNDKDAFYKEAHSVLSDVVQKNKRA